MVGPRDQNAPRKVDKSCWLHPWEIDPDASQEPGGLINKFNLALSRLDVERAKLLEVTGNSEVFRGLLRLLHLPERKSWCQ